MKFRFLGWFCGLVLLTAPSLWGQHFAFRTYTTTDGLPQSQIFTIFQDQAKYLWFGTLDGACRYDGDQFKVYNTASGLPDNHISTICEDQQGRIWFGMWKGGVAYLQPDQFGGRIERVFNTENSPLPHNRVNTFHVARNGDLWIGTNDGVCRVESSGARTFTFHIYQTDRGLMDGRVNAIFEDRVGQIWVGSWGGGLAKFDPEAEFFQVLTNLPDVRIASVMPARDSGHWIAMYGGNFVHFSVDDAGQEQIRAYNIKELGIDDRVNVVLERENNELWVATWRNGAVSFQLDDRLQLQNPQRYSTREGLANNQVRSLWEDHEGSVWIGTNGGGVCKFRSQMISNFTTASGLSQNLISALAQDSQQRVWIGTYDEGICLFENDRFRYFTEKDGLPGNQITLILEDHQQRIWVATREGLCYYNGERFVEDYTDQSGRHSRIISGCLMDDESIWFGTNGAGIMILKDRQVHYLTRDDGLPSEHARSIVQDRNGVIWVGTGTGLARYDGQAFQNFTHNDGLQDEQISMLMEDRQGRIWVAGDGGEGICYFDGETFTSFTVTDGLRHNVVYSMIEDAQGRIWLGGNQGIDRFNGSSFQNFNVEDGLASDQCVARAVIRDRSGKLWFGTIGGVTRIDPDIEIVNRIPPPVYITEFRIHDQPHAMPPGLELDYSSNYVAFAFQGLSFANEDEVLYQYYLQGLESDWSLPTHQNVVKYYNLGSNRYTFHVKACNNDGVWSEKQAQYSFVVAAPLWEQGWFLFMIFAVIIGLTYGGVVVRTRNLRQQKFKLEKMVEERTEEIVHKNLQLYERQEIIAEKNQEMMLKNSELEARQRIISDQKEKLEKQKTELEDKNEHLAELNELKNQFLGMAAHDLRNPLGVISAYLEILAHEDIEPEEQKRLIQQMDKMSHHMHDMISSLLDVVAIESGKVQLDFEYHTFQDVYDECLSFYHFQAEKKQIEIAAMLPEDLPPVYIDFNRIVEVLSNLISNALKYSHSHTRVEVRAAVEASFLHVHVVDQGVGLSADDLKKIFRSFQKLSSRPTAGESRTGLGLAIVKKLVELHGGDVWVESREDEGSTFSFSLPLSPEQLEK